MPAIVLVISPKGTLSNSIAVQGLISAGMGGTKPFTGSTKWLAFGMNKGFCAETGRRNASLARLVLTVKLRVAVHAPGKVGNLSMDRMRQYQTPAVGRFASEGKKLK